VTKLAENLSGVSWLKGRIASTKVAEVPTVNLVTKLNSCEGGLNSSGCSSKASVGRLG
jgi:hypothetical protein